MKDGRGATSAADAQISGPADFLEALGATRSGFRGRRTAIGGGGRGVRSHVGRVWGLNHFEGRSWRGWHHHGEPGAARLPAFNEFKLSAG